MGKTITVQREQWVSWRREDLGNGVTDVWAVCISTVPFRRRLLYVPRVLIGQYRMSRVCGNGRWASVKVAAYWTYRLIRGGWNKVVMPANPLFAEHARYQALSQEQQVAVMRRYHASLGTDWLADRAPEADRALLDQLCDEVGAGVPTTANEETHP